MWGEAWGTMIWGGAAFVPEVQVPIGPWALLILGFLLGVSAVLARRHVVARILPLAIVAVVPLMSIATISLVTFNNGEVADALAVNSNFDALKQELAALHARVSTNSSAISTNTSAISTNSSSIASTTTDLTEVHSDISANAIGVTALTDTLIGVTRETIGGHPTLVFSGVNVQLVDGTGDTPCAYADPWPSDSIDDTGSNEPCNGLGNLVVGYNEDIGDAVRTGSHNVLIGERHTYGGYGGFVAGYRNASWSHNTSVAGGPLNSAFGAYSSVSGGNGNYASGQSASVSGGASNRAFGQAGSVSGGSSNDAIGDSASVSGGSNNDAVEVLSSVSGGDSNEALGPWTSILGGRFIDTTGNFKTQFSPIESLFSGVTRETVGGHDTLRFSGMNVQIVDGTGETACAYADPRPSDGVADTGANETCNGKGNLIVGYHEDAGGNAVRGGAHNIIVGEEHDYRAYAGFVAGLENSIRSRHSSVSGGNLNSAAGIYSSVSGGAENYSGGTFSSVTGGRFNSASTTDSTVVGGSGNGVDLGQGGTVLGGYSNRAQAPWASVTGGRNNTAVGDYSSVTGGSNNSAGGQDSTVSGGDTRSVSGTNDWRAGDLFETN